MIDRNSFIKINPRKEDSFSKVSLDNFKDDFLSFFPNFPEEIVGQWPYRHFDDFSNEYRWKIEYDRLVFNKEVFPTSCFKRIEAENYSSNELYEWGMVQIEIDNWLSIYMKKHLQTPEPIILLDTESSNTDGEYAFKLPYHLLEGHRRTSLILALNEKDPLSLNNEQVIWMAKRI